MGRAARRTLVSYLILSCATCDPQPRRDPEACTAGQCDATAHVQSSVAFKARASLKAADAPADRADGAVMVSFFPGEVAEVRDWISCNVSGRGAKPNTYNILVPAGKGGSQEIHDIPSQGLRKARVGDRTPSSGALSFETGESAEVFGWTKCSISARGAVPDTYDVRKPTAQGVQHLVGIPAARLRRIRGPFWLHAGDPAVPSQLPGQDGGGMCKGAACEKLFAKCIAERRQKAEQNCGGRCDIIFIGDSIVEELSGRLCYSSGGRMPATAQIYRELVLSRHPKSMVLAGSSEETAQTLHMLDTALPVLRAPKVYLLMIGTNNIPKGGRARALRGIRAVVARLCKEHPETRVLLHTILPRSDDGNLHMFQRHIDELNGMLPDLVSEFRAAGSLVELVDCQGVLHRDPPEVEEHFSDKLHLKAAGYRAWLTCLRPALDRALSGAEQ